MGKIIIDLLTSIIAFPFVYAAASLAGFGWFDAFVANRTFTEHLGFMTGDSLLIWSFYFVFFLAIGIGLPALLRTSRPVAWAACFGLAYSLYRLTPGANYIFHPSISLYVSMAGEYVMPVLGCVFGALLGRRLRRMAPNNSFKPTPSVRLDSGVRPH